MRFLFLSLFLGLGLGFILANITFRIDVADQPLNLKPKTQANSPDRADKAKNLNESATDSAGSPESSLSLRELRQAVDQADQVKDNLQLQRDLGIALFKYSAIEQRMDFLADAIRLMERAADQKAFSQDKELLETLGNALFVEAQQDEPTKMLLARQAYQRALRIEPNNPEIFVNIGLTYFFEEPSNPAAAIIQYNQALKIQPRDEKALENMIIAWLALKRNTEALENLEKLRKLAPDNKSLNDLQVQVNQALLTDN